MAFLAPCRSCLQCLPIFGASPPSSPRLPGPSDPAPKPSPSPDPSDLPPSSAIADLPPAIADVPQSSSVALSQEQDLPSFNHSEEPRPVHAGLHDETDLPIPASAEEIDGKLLPEIVVTAPVCGSQSDSSLPLGDEDYGSKQLAASETSLHVPFINDISFATPLRPHLPSPTTPAPFGTGYGYPAGQCHPPQIFPPEPNEPSKDEASPKSEEISSQGEQANSAGHVSSPEGHDELMHHDNGQEVISPHGDVGPEENLSQGEQADIAGHVHSQEGHDELMHHDHGQGVGSPLGDVGPDENLSQMPSAKTDDSAGLETSISTPAFIGTDIAQKFENNNASAAMAGNSKPIEAYHSEPALPEVAEDDVYIADEGIGHKIPHTGRHRRRDHFKQQFKGIRQQIKEGGLHLREEGGKHLQTMMTNINKQAQEFEQSGRFVIPRLNNS